MGESSSARFDASLCTLCGLCVQVCPCHAVEIGENGPIFDCPGDCQGVSACQAACMCEDVCPSGAISCGFEIVLADDQTGLEAPERTASPGVSSGG